MKRIRVIIAKLKPQLLNDSLTAILEADSRVEVVASDVPTEGLQEAMTLGRTELVFVPHPRSQVLSQAALLMNGMPGVIVVGVEPNGERFSLHFRCPGLDTLIAILYAARGEGREPLQS